MFQRNLLETVMKGTPKQVEKAAAKLKDINFRFDETCNFAFDMEWKTVIGNTPLIIATAVNDNLEVIKTLIRLGADINAKNNCNENLLHPAAANKNPEVLKMVLTMGFDVNETNSYGCPPLFLASGNVANLKILLDKGANINVKDKNGLGVLHFAADRINPDVSTFNLLFNKGSLRGCLESVKLLIAKGAYVNVKDKDGLTPLMIAASNNNKEIVKALIDAGADISATDNKGRNALFIAQQDNSRNVIKILVKAGLKSDAKDIEGKTVEEYVYPKEETGKIYRSFVILGVGYITLLQLILFWQKNPNAIATIPMTLALIVIGKTFFKDRPAKREKKFWSTEHHLIRNNIHLYCILVAIIAYGILNFYYVGSYSCINITEIFQKIWLFSYDKQHIFIKHFSLDINVYFNLLYAVIAAGILSLNLVNPIYEKSVFNEESLLRKVYLLGSSVLVFFMGWIFISVSAPKKEVFTFSGSFFLIFVAFVSFFSTLLNIFVAIKDKGKRVESLER
ncbi:MAG: ankyrin repeat domain-containing protein [Alphaproteobacteria bacterium]